MRNWFLEVLQVNADKFVRGSVHAEIRTRPMSLWSSYRLTDSVWDLCVNGFGQMTANTGGVPMRLR